MKKRSKRAKSSFRLHGEVINSSYNELKHLDFHPGKKPKPTLLEALDLLQSAKPK
ncbi:hypothetical protein [Paenibacillus arenilitoris]|uniref:Uncharacterized protein n=1 Tax=Paenibacillus arenilitoris TaxID=2772299 RepID=A0A927CN06_9BACL|nr:hypothetical protein [Paenibacillus arenilitoris]MBD2868585.1 hypothetical protein [Paenibacillus arenilitoris]